MPFKFGIPFFTWNKKLKQVRILTNVVINFFLPVGCSGIIKPNRDD